MALHPAASSAAQVVVKAWTEPTYKARLLQDPRAALRELGIEFREDIELEVYDNNGPVHHAIICSECSCYPTWLAPMPSFWKDPAYKAKVNRDAAETLATMGLTLDDDVALKIVDTTAARRAMVLPRHPDPQGQLSASDLAQQVTNLTIIGHAR